MPFKTIVLFLCLISSSLSLANCQISAAENRIQREYTINELIKLATEKNPSVPSAISSIDIAKGELRAAKAYPNPEVEFSLDKGKSREDNSSEAEYGIAVIQPIEWPLKRLYRRKAAEEEVKVTEFEKEAVRVELIFTTKQLYYATLLAKKDVEIARQNLDTSKTLLSIIERRVELGESRELDFIKSRVETLKFERELIRAETNLSAVKSILNRFLGNSLEKDFDIDGELTPPSTISGLEQIAEKVADFNPQLKAQKVEVKRTGFSLLEQKHLIVPDIFLQGFYDREIDKTALGGGIGISIPLWYQNQGGIQSARAEERKASFDLKLLEIEIGNRLEDQYKNYKVAFEQSKIYSTELLGRAKRSLEIAQFSYEQGEIGLLDVLDALRTYRDTLREYYQVLFEFYMAEISLEKIAGGEM
ncbi:MAG TPA: TolC family protein [Thermodesulfobacteriota bacterium]|nr:TolC family protein [Thermodesulfobacteriota bacterium]